MPPTSDAPSFRQSQVYALVLGQTVLRLRERHRLTQGDLAARVGLTQSTLSRIERGQAQPDPYMLRQLAAAFGMTVGEFDEHVQDAYQRTEQAAQSAVRGQQDEKWWEVALSIAGVVGLAGLVAFAVAAVVNDLDQTNARQPRARRTTGTRARSHTPRG